MSTPNISTEQLRADYSKYIRLWKIRSEMFRELATHSLGEKGLQARLTSISYFNGIFEQAVKQAADQHHTSGLVEYQRLTAKLRSQTDG